MPGRTQRSSCPRRRWRRRPRGAERPRVEVDLMVADQADAAARRRKRGHAVVRPRRDAPIVETIAAPAERHVAEAFGQFQQAQAGGAIGGRTDLAIAVAGARRALRQRAAHRRPSVERQMPGCRSRRGTVDGSRMRAYAGKSTYLGAPVVRMAPAHPISGLSSSYVMRMSERGARPARREERAYREYSSDEQRRQTGCPPERRVTYDEDRPLATKPRPGRHQSNESGRL